MSLIFSVYTPDCDKDSSIELLSLIDKESSPETVTCSLSEATNPRIILSAVPELPQFTSEFGFVKPFLPTPSTVITKPSSVATRSMPTPRVIKQLIIDSMSRPNLPRTSRLVVPS